MVDDYGNFPVSAPIGNFKECVTANYRNITTIAYQFGNQRSRSFERFYESIPEPVFGINAVYKLYNQFFHGNLQFRPEFNKDEAYTFATRLIKAFGPATYASPLSWEDWSNKAYDHWEKTDNCNPFKWYQHAEAIRHLKVAKGLKSYKSHCSRAETQGKSLPFIDQKVLFGNRGGAWNVHQHRNVTVIVFTAKRANDSKSYVLLTKDLTRLSQLLESTGRIFEYFSMYADETGTLSSNLVTDANEIITMLVKSFEEADNHTANSICRSMDIGMYIYLAEQAGPLAKRSVELQKAKGFDGHYDKVFPLLAFLGILRKWRIREAIELSSIRKILPVPDFCIFSAMNKNYKMHYAPHDQIETEMDGVNIADFSLYWSWSMVRNFYDRHKRCPGFIKEDVEYKAWHGQYPDIEPIKIPYTEISDIDFWGTFIFKDYAFAEHELRKDKTMAPNRMDYGMTAEEYKALPITEQNQVAKFLLDPSIKTLTMLREELLEKRESYDYVSLTALKPESKKEDGRMFYMANDAQRVMMSEKEANVAEYLSFKAGNSAGISDIELSKRMNEIASIDIDAGRKIYVSFDLEKWSPKMNPQLKKMSYAQWSYAFGLPHINDLSKVTDGSRMVFLKHNVHHEYINPGQDLEGYDAKTNTAMHIEVMSYAINVCRRFGKLKKGAKLLALIDDGGMSLEFERGTSDEEIWECIELIEKVYQMVGLRISWDKTFVSDRLFQYLNEIYYRGFKVTPGLKAFLRVGKLNDVPARTICDDLDAISGEIQGAIKAGASYRMVFAAYAMEVFKLMKRWTGFKGVLGDAQILCALFPVAMGGVGMKSLIQLATNESINPITAGLGNLKAFCMYYPQNAKLVNTMLNAKMRAQTSEAFLRAPQSIRQQGMTLNLQRFAIKMKEWIIGNARNPYVTSVLAAIDTTHAKVMIERIANMKSISAVGLKTIADMQPDEALNLLVSKLQRSNTAAELLGHRDCVRIALANRYQAEHVVRNFGQQLRLEKLSYIH
jgi:hypothetical protein